MADEKFQEMKGLWAVLFKGLWPMWVGGILVGFISVLMFLVKSPWGGTGSYMNWGQNLFGSLGMMETTAKPLLESRYGVLGIMTILGAMAAALMARQFLLRIGTIGELFKGFFGGALMAIGATIGLGCTIGGFFSGWAALSVGALAVTAGLMIGAVVGLRYILWEKDHLPFMEKGKRQVFFRAKKTSMTQPIIGLVLFVGLLVLAAVLFADKAILTWFAIFGLLIGAICQRSQFCIVRGFREPFMTGMSEAPVGLMAGLLVALLGITVIKYMGIGADTVEEARKLALVGVHANSWIRGLAGGFIFGIGMVIAGGCAVGTMWRMGEGYLQLWFAAAGLILVAPFSKAFIAPAFAQLLPAWGREKVFMPDWLGYGGSVALSLLLILGWYLFVKWNERTDKFTAF